MGNVVIIIRESVVENGREGSRVDVPAELREQDSSSGVVNKKVWFDLHIK
jgi:hypothetical protein